MNLDDFIDDFIIAVFCEVDEAITRALKGRRLRQRGPAPILAESALFASFRRHYAHYFPALAAPDDLRAPSGASVAAQRTGLARDAGAPAARRCLCHC